VRGATQLVPAAAQLRPRQVKHECRGHTFVLIGLHQVRAPQRGNPSQAQAKRAPRLRCRKLGRAAHPEIRPRHGIFSCLRLPPREFRREIVVQYYCTRKSARVFRV
jgi:hypothetical protein